MPSSLTESIYRILYIDDAKPLHEEYGNTLEDLSGQIYTVHVERPRLGLQTLLNNNFDLLVLDYLMPGLKGDRLLELYLNEAVEPVPTIAFSSIESYNKRLCEFPNVIGFLNKDFEGLKYFITDKLDEKRISDDFY